MLQAHLRRRLRQAQRLERVGSVLRLARVHVAIAARARARVAEDLERRGALAPALGDVRAARLLAHRVEARAVDQLLDVEVAPVGARRAHLHPRGAARAIGDGKRRLHEPKSTFAGRVTAHRRGATRGWVATLHACAASQGSCSWSSSPSRRHLLRSRTRSSSPSSRRTAPPSPPRRRRSGCSSTIPSPSAPAMPSSPPTTARCWPGAPRLERKDHLLVLPLRPHLPNGDYSVSWRVFSDDGHLESGVLAFRVGAAAAGAGAPRSVLEPAATRPGAVDILARWLLLGGILIAGGTALFFLLVSRAAVRRTATTMAARPARRRARRRLARPRRRRRGDALRAGHGGHRVRRARRRPCSPPLARARPKLVAPALVLPLALLLAPTFAGHAYRAWDGRPISIAADLVHVVAAAFWTGGILQLALLLRGGQDERAVRRFSLFALPAVVLIAGSGLARAIVELTAVSQLWSTGYGRAIVAKTVLFVVLIVLGWMSRQALGDPARLRRSVRVELVLLALVVVAVAVLTSLRPGRDVSSDPGDDRPRGCACAGTAARDGRLRPPGAGARGRALGAPGHAARADGHGDRPVRASASTASTCGSRPAPAAGIRSVAAQPCGHGCYAASIALAHPTALRRRSPR